MCLCAPRPLLNQAMGFTLDRLKDNNDAQIAPKCNALIDALADGRPFAAHVWP